MEYEREAVRNHVRNILRRQKMIPPTLPESLLAAVKVLVKAHEDLTREVEEWQALCGRIQSDIDRLVARSRSLDNMPTDLNAVVTLPRAIVPNTFGSEKQEQPSKGDNHG